MERYVYYSIILFSSFIFLLYVYLLYQKALEFIETKKEKVYKKEVIPFIDKIMEDLENRYPDEDKILKVRTIIKNRIKRKLIIERINVYIELYNGKIRISMTRLCEETGIVDYELKNLKKGDKFNIALSCKNLGEFRSKSALSELTKIIDKNFVDIRYHSLMAISKIGDANSLVYAFNKLSNNLLLSDRSLTEIIDSFEGDKAQLYKSMINSDDLFLSTIFIKSAGNYMDIDLNYQIAKYIDDEDKNRRIAAIKAIGQNGDVRFLDKLIHKLKDEEWEVRSAASKSLGRLGDSKALPKLVESLSDSQWWVRYNSARSIFQIPRGIEIIETVIKGEDKFAKDILIASLEDSGVINDIYLYENSQDEKKRDLANLVRKYVIYRES